MKAVLSVVLVPIMTNHAETSLPNPPKDATHESQEISVDARTKLVFDARLVQAKKFEVNLTESSEFEGTLWYFDTSPPRMILKEGYLLTDGKKVNLDMSSLANF